MRATDRRGRADRLRCRRLIAGLVLSLVLSSTGAKAEGSGAASNFLVGMSAGVLTLVYTPLKLIYATSTIPISGLVYVWSIGNAQVAGRLLRCGTQGTFVLTPEHLRGNVSLDFVGPDSPRDEMW
jgi:hypothetical protein